MSLAILRSFTEVYRSRSISAAARNLGLTQPAVSQHIAALEEQIGRALFHREPRGMAPTRVAADLAAEIGDGLDRAEAALSVMKARSAQLSGTVHLAGPSELMEGWIAPHLRELQDAGLRLRIHLGGKLALYEMLLSGQVDLAFTASTPQDPQLDHAHIGTERLLVVAAPHLAREIARAPEPEVTLRKEPFVAYDSDLPLIRQWCQANRIPLPEAQPTATAPDIRMLRALVLAGAGWTVMPDYLCSDAVAQGTLVSLQAPLETPQNAFYLAWVKSALRHPRVAHTKQLLLNALVAP